MSNTIKIKVELDLDNHAHVKAFTLFLNSVNGETEPEAEVVAPTKPRTRRSSEQVKADKLKEEASKAEDTNTDTTTEEATIKIQDVRSMLQTKVTEHRDAIKAKLSELGANNVTSLEEDK